MRIQALLFALLISVSAFAQRTDDVITPIAGAPHLLIPAAGDAPGANGTHFRSDIMVINLRTTAQRIQLYWLPQGASGLAITPITLDLGPQQGFSSENFASNVMLQSGVGSIEIVGVRADNSFDVDARLHAAARIWTPRPDGAAGTMSQTFPTIVLQNELIAVKAIFGLRRGSQYRVNVGISNPIEQARRFRVTVVVSGTGTPTQTQFDVDVNAQSMEQRTVSGSSEGVVQVLVEDITSPAQLGPWHAWASSIDNFSGDAWSQMAVPGS